MSAASVPEPPPRVAVQKRVILVNAASAVAAQGASLVLLIWLQRYLLSRVDVAEYALYPIVLAPMLLVPLLVSTLTGAAGRYVVERWSVDDGSGVTEIVSTALPLAIGLAAVLGALGASLVVGIDSVLEIEPALVGDARMMLSLLLGLAVLRVATAPLTVGPFVRQRFVLDSVIVLGTQVLRLVLVFALLVLVDARVLWVVVGTVAAEAIGWIASLVVSRRLVPELVFRRGAIRWREASRLASFGSWSFAQGAAMAVRRASAPIVLNRLAGSIDVACFHLGALVLAQLQQFVAIGIQPLLPPLVALHANNERARLQSVYLRGSRYGLWIALFFATPLVLFREPLVVLYVGEEFIDAAAAMALLVLHLPFRLGNVMLRPLAAATDNVRPMALAALCIHGAAVLLMAIVVAAGHGAVGAALASFVVTAAGQPLIMWRLGRRIAGVSLGEWTKAAVVPALLPTAAGAAAWLTLRAAASPATWASLAACILSGAIVFVLVLLAIGLTDADRRDLAAAVRALAGRRGRPRPDR